MNRNDRSNEQLVNNRYVPRPFLLAIATCAGLGLAQSNCAKMSLQKAPATERILDTRQEPEEGSTTQARITQEGQVVLVEVSRNCVARTYDRVETTERSTTINTQGALDWTLGISGVALLGVAGVTYADSPKVYPKDTSSRTYNEVGPEGERGIAVVTALTGGALLGIAVVDVIRAQGTEEGAPTLSWRKGAVSGKCPSIPVDGAQIVGTLARRDGSPIALGRTNADGTLEVNLANIPVPADPGGDIDGEPYGPTLDVRVGSIVAGKAELAGVYPTWRETWQSQRTGAEQARADAAARQRAQEAAAAAAIASRQRILEKLDRWAQSNVRATFAARSHHSETCYNRVNTEVPCDSAAAYKKNTRDWSENTARVTNGASRLTLACTLRDTQSQYMAGVFAGTVLAGTPDVVEIAHGKTRTLASESNALVNELGGSVLPWQMMCAAPLASVVQEAQLPIETPEVFGASGDVAVIAIIHDINTRRSTYAYSIRGRTFIKKDGNFVEVR